jgi:tetratricopeptide (TPR) repeat protein
MTHARLLADVQMVRELTRIETERTTWTQAGRFDNPKALREYEALFAQAKLDVAGGDLTELARSIRDSPIRKSILEGLDNWVLVCAYETHFGSGENLAELELRRDRLLELARRVDPDPLRDQVRTPEIWVDHQELEGLAQKAQQEKLPPRVAALLAEVLRLEGLKDGNLEPLLRTYQGHYQNDFWLNLDLAKLLQLKGKCEEALMFYQAALAVKPHNLIVLNNMAIICYEQRNAAGALGYLKLAEHSPPDNVVVRTNLGTAWLANGHPEIAIQQYQRALAINCHDAPAHYLLGKVHQRRGEIALAVKHYKLAQQCVPHYPRLGLLDRRIEIPKDREELAAIIDAALSSADVLPVMQRTGDSAGLGAK